MNSNGITESTPINYTLSGIGSSECSSVNEILRVRQCNLSPRSHTEGSVKEQMITISGQPVPLDLVKNVHNKIEGFIKSCGELGLHHLMSFYKYGVEGTLDSIAQQNNNLFGFEVRQAKQWANTFGLLVDDEIDYLTRDIVLHTVSFGERQSKKDKLIGNVRITLEPQKSCEDSKPKPFKKIYLKKGGNASPSLIKDTMVKIRNFRQDAGSVGLKQLYASANGHNEAMNDFVTFSAMRRGLDKDGRLQQYINRIILSAVTQSKEGNFIISDPRKKV